MIYFLIKHELKIAVSLVIIYITGSLFLPTNLPPIWVKSIDFVVQAEDFNNAYWYIVTGPSILIGIGLGSLIGLKNHRLAYFFGIWWCFLSILFGILACLYSTEYLFSSICLCVVGLLIIFTSYIDKKRVESSL